jgi:hypothetical protein
MSALISWEVAEARSCELDRIGRAPASVRRLARGRTIARAGKAGRMGLLRRAR